MRTLFGIIGGIIKYCVLPSIVLNGIIWFAFGTFSITSTFGEEKLTGADVFVDGRRKCSTPCKFRLLPGAHTIKVFAPDDIDAAEASKTVKFFAVDLGTDMDFDFSSAE